MKLLISVFVSLLLVSGARAAGEDDDKVAATKALLEYFNAFVTLDAVRIASHYNEPFMFVTAATTVSFPTRADIESRLTPVLAKLKERGYGHSEWPQVHVKLLNDGLAIPLRQNSCRLS